MGSIPTPGTIRGMKKDDKQKKSRQKDRLERLLFYARKHIGKPYKYGARPWQAPRKFDCSSFVQYCYRQIGITLPRVSIVQATKGKKVGQWPATLRAGDVIFIRGTMGRYNRDFPEGIGHVALYAGNAKVIHAEGVLFRRVVEEPLTRFLKRSKVTIVKRYL